VNVVGCLIAGLALGALSEKGGAANWQLFLVTGLLGGLTTFSAFGLETVGLIKAGEVTAAALYVLATLLAAFLGVYAGLRLSGV
jgi:CrcB protein